MFIGWIRRDRFLDDLEKLSLLIAVDKNLIIKTVQEDQSLSFGAYNEEGDLEAIVTAYSFKNSILINNLYYIKDIKVDIIKRLFQVLLNNILQTNLSILFMANKFEQEILKNLGFNKYANFTKAVHKGAAVAFNFSNATSKSISNPNYIPTVTKLDVDTFKENRVDYIFHIVAKQSSLMLSTQFGYQHSYALTKDIIKISPWIMVDEAFTDAEKLIRGVLYHRGLKTIVSFIPSNTKEIIDLYKSYKFEFVEEFALMYLNKKPNFNLDSIYGF
jgi:hypothetical protein